MDEFIRGSSSYTRIRMQVCFKAKYCHEVFGKWGFRVRCEEIFRGAAKDLGVQIIEIGFDDDHVHMTWQIQVVHRIDHLAKVFKGRSAKKLLREFPEIKKSCFWGSGLVADNLLRHNRQQCRNCTRVCQESALRFRSTET